MKDTAKPLKGIRIQILTLLARKQDLTVADMIDSLPDFSEKQIGDNCYQAKQDGLLSSRMDGITRKQAYSITEQGKARIKSEAAPVKDSLTTDPVKPAVTIDQVIHEIFPVSTGELAELRKLVEDGAKENMRLRAELKEIAEMSNRNAVSAVSVKMQDDRRIKELSDALEQERDEAMRLKARCDDLMQTNAEIARSALSSSDQQQVTVEQFLIRVPKHKPFVVKSLEKARQRAMSAAKSVGKAEVFAMVLVGHAMRGAVWEQS